MPDPRSPFQDLGDRLAMGLSSEWDKGTDPRVDAKLAELIGRADYKIKRDDINPGMKTRALEAAVCGPNHLEVHFVAGLSPDLSRSRARC